MIAAAGILENQGLDIAANLTTSISSYQSVGVVSAFLDVVSQAQAAGNTVISAATLQSLRNLGSTTVPFVTDSFSAATGNTPAGQFSGAIVARANLIMGNGDLSVFAQIFNTSRGYISTANQFINSANSTGAAAATFINMDAVTTGGLSLVSTNIPQFGLDLSDLGTALNPADLDNIGFPSAIIRQVLNAGGLLPVLEVSLAEYDITSDILFALDGATTPLAGDIEKRIYQAMQTVTGDALQQVLFLLDVTTTGLTSMSDLLNPYVIFPRSALDLVILVGSDTVPIYLAAGTINNAIDPEFATDNRYILLRKIIPADQALANRALGRSLLQIKNILSLSLPDVAGSAALVESNNGLSDITSLTTPVPESDLSAVKTSLSPGGTSTGTDGAFVLYDFVGTAAGYPYESAFPPVISALDEIQAQSGFQGLLDSGNGAYIVMTDTLDGVYGDPTTGPIGNVPSPFNSGEPYANADLAFQTYITVTQGILGNIANTYSDQVQTADPSWQDMLDQYSREPENWQLAMLEIDELLGNNRPATMSLVTGLHDIGTDVSPRGGADFFAAVANVATPSGQAIVASLREGRNIKNLEDAGIGMDTQLPT